MKTSISIVVLLLIVSCNYKPKEDENINVAFETGKIDTIYTDDVIMEMNENTENGRPTVKLNSFDKNNKKLIKPSKDTIFLRALYHSEKFPELNENYQISIEAVSDNITVLNQVSRNKIKLFIDPDSTPFVFDVYLSSKRNVFKSSNLNSNKEITYKVEPVIFLFRKTIVP